MHTSLLRALRKNLSPDSPRRPLRRNRGDGRRKLRLESLESRAFLSATPGFAEPFHSAVANDDAVPMATAGPTGYTPTQIRRAYGFDKIAFNNGTVPGDGAGTTIAIVNAFDHPNIASDLHQFNLKFGLPDTKFTKVDQWGGTNYPAPNAIWASEIALDVEWAHAIAPKANILLVEASDNSYTNLMAAVDYARQVPGVVAVSMSWGGPEFSTQSSYDSYFTTPAGHGGVTFLAASGDTGSPVNFPSISPNVVSVGGTTLSLSSTGSVISEAGWSGSGGGLSSYVAQPAYQKGVVTQNSARRANPDVAYNSNPNTGFPVYDTYNNPASTPWTRFGGTSAAAPQWAGLIAIANQGRALAGQPALDGATQTLPTLYGMPSADYYDVASGMSVGSPVYLACAGYDLVTGLGRAYADRAVSSLLGNSTQDTMTVEDFEVARTYTVVNATTATAARSTSSRHNGSYGLLDSPGNDWTYRADAETTVKQGDTLSVWLKFGTVADGRAYFGFGAGAAGTLSLVAAPDTNQLLLQNNAGYKETTLATISSTWQANRWYRLEVNWGSGGKIVGKVYDSDGRTLLKTVSATDTTVTSGGIAFRATGLNKKGWDTVQVTPGVTASGTLEDFEAARSYAVANGTTATAAQSTSSRHDGSYGLLDSPGDDWIYRTDAAATVKQGDTISVWLKFGTVADGRAYFGFGAGAAGTLSLVAAPDTNQLLLQNNAGYKDTTLAATSATWVANRWYRLEVNWGSSGKIVGKVYGSDGTTLLNTVTATDTSIASGGIAFRATGLNKKAWDTVQVTCGVNPSISAKSTRGVDEVLADVSDWMELA